MRIVTWNVNSVRSRKDRVVAWLERHGPDVVCLQETKTVDETFPADAFSALGYRSATFGQKTYNGVAILSREEPANVRRGLPGDGPDDQKRIIAADVETIAKIRGEVRAVTVFKDLFPLVRPVEGEAELGRLLAITAAGYIAIL